MCKWRHIVTAAIVAIAYWSATPALTASTADFARVWRGRTVVLTRPLYSIQYSAVDRLSPGRVDSRTAGITIVSHEKGVYYLAQPSGTPIADSDPDRLVARVTAATANQKLESYTGSNQRNVTTAPATLLRYDPGTQMKVAEVIVRDRWVRLDLDDMFHMGGPHTTSLLVEWPQRLSRDFSEQPAIEELIRGFLTWKSQDTLKAPGLIPASPSAAPNPGTARPAGSPPEVVLAVLDFNEYVVAGYRTKSPPPSLIRLWPLLITSGDRFESLMVNSSVLPGPKPYQERLLDAQNQARSRLSALRPRLESHREFTLSVEGAERATFQLTRCALDDQSAGDLGFRCEGTIRVKGTPQQSLDQWLAGAVAVSPAIPQSEFWTVEPRLLNSHKAQLATALGPVYSGAKQFVPAQRRLGEKSARTVVVDVDRDGIAEIFHSSRSEGQPCGEMYASLFVSWNGTTLRTIRSSASLAECPGAESAGEDTFSPSFVDVDGDGVAEVLMNEGSHEARGWVLYRLEAGVLRKLLTIGAFGSLRGSNHESAGALLKR